jgi:hypothetical protein
MKHTQSESKSITYYVVHNNRVNQLYLHIKTSQITCLSITHCVSTEFLELLIN